MDTEACISTTKRNIFSYNSYQIRWIVNIQMTHFSTTFRVSGTPYFGVSETSLFLDLLITQMPTNLVGMKFG